jgi:NitT/TauT family transport system substrate-binding protein
MRRTLVCFAGAFAVAGMAVANVPAAAGEKFILTHALPRLSPSFAIASSLPAYLGYWKEEGLEVEVVPTHGASAAVQMVLGGKVGASYGNPSSAMVAVQKGADLKFYYTSIRGDIFGVAIIKDSGIKELADLKGKTVGVSSFASGSTLYAKAVLAKAGLKESDYSLVEIGVGGRAAAAIKSNQVQAVSLWDEAFAGLEKAGIHIEKVIKDPSAKNFIAGSLTVRTEDLQKKRKQLIGLARGIAKAAVFEAANPAAAVRIHWKVYPQTAPRAGVTDAEVASEVRVVDARRPKHGRDMMDTGMFGDIPKARMEDFQAYLVSIGELSKNLAVDQYYTNELIKEINDFDSEKIKAQAKSFKLN